MPANISALLCQCLMAHFRPDEEISMFSVTIEHLRPPYGLRRSRCQATCLLYSKRCALRLVLKHPVDFRTKLHRGGRSTHLSELVH